MDRDMGFRAAGRLILQAGLLLAFWSPLADAANFFSRASAGWSTVGTWSATGCPGGGSSGAVPGVGDVVTICAGNTVTMTAATANIASLTINATGVLTQSQPLTMSGALTVNGTLTSTNTVSVGGTTNVNGGGALNTTANVGTHTFTGNVTVAGTWNNSGNKPVSFGGNLTNSGTFTPGTGLQTFTAATAQWTCTAAVTFNSVTVNNDLNVAAGTCNLANTTSVGGNTTVAGTLGITNVAGTKTFSGDVTVTGTWNNSANELVTFGGNLTNSGTFTPGTGLQTFTAAITQWDCTAAVTFNTTTVNNDLNVNSGTCNLANTTNVGGNTTVGGTLRISNAAGTKTFSGDVTVTGTWTNNVVNENVSFGGNLTNSGTFNSGTGTQTFTAATAQWDCTNAITFNGTVTVNNALNVASGTCNINATIGVTGATDISGTLAIINTAGTKTFTGAVTINNGGTLSESVAEPIAYGNNLTIATGGTLTENGAATMTIAGSLSNNGTLTASTGVHTLSGAGQTISGTVSIPSVTVSGTYTNNDTLTVNSALAGAGGLTNAATGTLNIGGTSGITTLTATAVGNTVNYTGAGQTIKVTTYHHLNLTGSGAPTFAVTTVNGDLSTSGTVNFTTAANLAVGGSLTVGSGTGFGVGGFNISVTGPTSVSGTLTHSNATGTKTYTGDVTVNGGGTWNESVAGVAISFGGNLRNDATFTANTGVHTFTGAGKTFSGANPISIPSVTVSGTYQNNGTLSVTTALAGAGTLTNGASGTLNIGFLGPPAITTLTATAVGNTVNYNLGGAQTVRAVSYHNLTLSNSGAKAMGSVTTVAGNLTLSGSATMTGNAGFTVGGTLNYNSSGSTTLTAATPVSMAKYSQTAGTLIDNGNTITVTGTGASTWSQAGGTFTPTGTVTFTGAAPQIGTSNFRNLRFNIGATNTAALTGNATVANQLVLSAGQVSTGSNTLITSANCPGSVSRTSGHVVGNLQLSFAAGAQTCTFHVGDSGNDASYTPMAISFTNVSVAGRVTGSTINTDYSDPGTPIDVGHSVNRYWTLTSVGTFAFTGTYNLTFTYLSTDNDPGNIASLYFVGKGDSCSPNCTWTLPTISGTPTTTSATATGMTTLSTSPSELTIGRRGASQFAILLPASPVSTCNAQSIQITAQDSSGNTASNYTGTVNISTSTADGDWSLTTGGGTLNNTGGFAGSTDDGKATYAFVSADAGVVTLSLATILVNSDVTITVADAATSASTTSATMQYRGNQFAISNDAIQVAGKDQAMTVTRQRGASCATTLNEYAGSKPLKAWYTTDTDHPAGATAPAITGASPAITTSVPGANNLTLTFSNGAASFTLTTTDVGKYAINLRDSAAGNVDGTSPTITTRPFAIVVTGIKQGTTNNPSGTATGGSKFVAAGNAFEATIEAYRWQAGADGNSDGVPDGGASLAAITGGSTANRTLRFAWATTLAAAAPITPGAGTLGTLSGGSVVSGDFGSGAANPPSLSYSEVGSFTLDVSVTSFLNTAGADFTVANLKAIVFDSGASRNGVVGRIYPDHFTLVAGSSITPGCGTFAYGGQPSFGYSFTIEARNASNVKTNNYANSIYAVGGVAIQAENNNNGIDLSSRLTGPSGSWSSGSYAFTTSTDTFTRAASPDGPFDSLLVGVTVSDNDGAVLAGRNMNPATSTDCTLAANCTGISIASATKVRFGRLRMQNALVSSTALALPVTIETQYWNGTDFVRNTLDSCTSLGQGTITLSNYVSNLNACETKVNQATVGFASGVGTLTLAAPGAGNGGSVLLTPNLGSTATGNYCATVGGSEAAASAANRDYLRGAWSGGTYDSNPSARATWGVFSAQPQNFIFQRENY